MPTRLIASTLRVVEFDVPNRQVHVDRACTQKLHWALSAQKDTELDRLFGHGLGNGIKPL